LASTGMLAVLRPETPAPSIARAKPHAAMPRLCGSGHFTDREVEQIERFVAAEQKRRGVRGVTPAATSIGTIYVAFHVIYYYDGFFTQGLLTEADVENQIQALNDAYDNIDFDLVRDPNTMAPLSITYTQNNDWFLNMAPGTVQETQAKTALHWDTTQYLNIYTCAGGGLLGWATFPWELRANPVNDGVVIAFDSVPGGTPPYDLGYTAVHEVGHWTGLYHTFQGGCNRLNDRVQDTPAEASANFGCPASRDTCPSAGEDPIHNYMDYSDDACMTEFTEGQFSRGTNMLRIFRSAAIVVP